MEVYNPIIADQLMNDLKKLILDFEAEHHLDLIVKFEPERWCYTSDMNYADVSELLRKFFESHYFGDCWCRGQVDYLDVFDQVAENCEEESITEFCGELINATNKLLNNHIAPIVDKHWAKIEETMANVQKYFPGLKIINEYNEYYDYDVSMVYFTRYDKLVIDEFDLKELHVAYHAITDLCFEITFFGNEAPVWIRYQDYWFDNMYKYIPEEQIDKINPGKYVLFHYSNEYDFKAIMNVFKYFDKNNDIKIKDGWW